MDRDLVQQIAQTFLGSYWQERLSEAPHDLELAFYDSFLHGIKLYPKARIKKRRLEKMLGALLGPRVSVRVPKGKRTATIRITGVTKRWLAADLGHVKDVLKKLKTHCRVTLVELEEAPDTELALRITLEVPLENLILWGSLPLEALTRGTVSNSPMAVRIDDQTCPHCNAKHLIVYGRKSHSQDSDDIPFACRRCGRVELVAHGIPELVNYRIDLEERMPWLLRRAHAKQAAAWRRSSRFWDVSSVSSVQLILGASFLVPAAILVYAWYSNEKFHLSVFHGARTLASVCCAIYGLSLLALSREQTEFGEGVARFSFAATLATLIPVWVALRH